VCASVHIVDNHVGLATLEESEKVIASDAVVSSASEPSKGRDDTGRENELCFLGRAKN